MEWAKWPENVLLKLGAHQFNVIMRKAAAVATTATARSRKGWPIHDTWIHVKHPAEHGPVLLECLRVWAVLLCEWRNDTIKIQIKTKAAFSLHDRSNGPSEHSACIQEENQPWWVSLYLSFCCCCCFKQWTATENAGKKNPTTNDVKTKQPTQNLESLFANRTHVSTRFICVLPTRPKTPKNWTVRTANMRCECG